MKTLKKFDFPAAKGGNGERHDWEKLLDGGIYQVEEGVDFHCKAATFNTLARSRAKKRDGTVRISKVKIGETGSGFVLQFIPNESTETTTG